MSTGGAAMKAMIRQATIDEGLMRPLLFAVLKFRLNHPGPSMDKGECKSAVVIHDRRTSNHDNPMQQVNL